MKQHVDDSIGAYALGALEPDEQAEVERHLAVCDRCQAELEVAEETLGQMALSLEPETPSPQLKDRLMAAVAADSQVTPAAESDGTVDTAPEPISLEGRRRRWRRFAMPAVAAAALILIVAGVLISRQHQQSAQQQYAAYVDQARSRGDKVIVLKPIRHAKTEATLTVAKSGQASLIVGPSSPPPPKKVYQLWYMNVPLAKGVTVFRTSKDKAEVLKLHRSPQGYKLTGITAEPGPNGSPKPRATRS